VILLTVTAIIQKPENNEKSLKYTELYAIAYENGLTLQYAVLIENHLIHREWRNKGSSLFCVDIIIMYS
jgi:hypothetical protein